MNDELRRRWQDWERLPYPTSQHPPGSEVAGVDLALSDGDAAAIFHHFFGTGELPHGEEHLREVLRDLSRALPQLRGPAQAYFQEAVELLRAIRAQWIARSGEEATSS